MINDLTQGDVGMRYFATIIFIIFISIDSLLAASIVVPADRVTTGVRVRENIDSKHPSQFLNKGESAEYIKSIPRWHKVKLDNGYTGYVSKSWTKLINALQDKKKDEIRIHTLPIGAGTCVLVECPGENTSPMILDCGSFGPSSRTNSDMTEVGVKSYIDPILNKYSKEPNVFISHADKDHHDWIDDILGTRKLGEVWLGGKSENYKIDDFNTWLKSRESEGTKVIKDLEPHWHNDGYPLDSVSCGDASLFVLTVNSTKRTDSPKNGNSLVLSIEHNEFVATFPGDAEGPTEQKAISNFNGAVKTTLLHSSHHGAWTHGSNNTKKGVSSKSDWPSYTSPEIVIHSAGKSYSHPRCEAVEEYEGYLSNVNNHDFRCGTASYEYDNSSTDKAHYVTEVNGVIIVTTDGKSPAHIQCLGKYNKGICNDYVSY